MGVSRSASRVPRSNAGAEKASRTPSNNPMANCVVVEEQGLPKCLDVTVEVEEETAG